MRGARAFVDTNILLRAFHKAHPEHEPAKSLFDRMFDENYELWINRQVIREYLVQATHQDTFKNLLSIETVLKHLERITSICYVASETEAVTSTLLELLKTYPTRGKQVHDTNIVATMLANDIDTLLTLNVEHFKRFSDRIKLIPLKEASE